MERDDSYPAGQPVTGPAPAALRDPVCHRRVESTTSHQCLHHGHLYYFCSAHCLKKFRASPGKHLSRSAERGHRVGQAKSPDRRGVVGASYTCPAHPETIRLQPGACPHCGMALEPLLPTADEGRGLELRDFKVRLWWTLPFSLLVVVLALAGRQLDLFAPTTQSWVELALALPALLGAARPIFRRGWQSFLAHRLDMWSLITLGTAVSFGYSVLATALPGLFPASFVSQGRVTVCYDATVAIITLTIVGQVIALGARERSSGAVRGLLRLIPRDARRVRSDGTEEEIPVAQVRVGDLLRVRAGEQIPVDGIVTEGEGAVDESRLTGAHGVQAKQPGSQVIGATVAKNGAFVMRAEHVGDNMMLSQVVQTVHRAQHSKAPLQQRADRIAGYFTLGVLLSAFLTFLGWGMLAGEDNRWLLGLLSAVSVLIIACPCALGLSTPLAVVVATGRAASAGIFFRDAAAMEQLSRVDTLVIDKTGTITEGRPVFSHCMPMRGHEADEILRLAASLDQASAHPLADSLVRAARERGLALEPATRFTSEAGMGVRGDIGGRHLALGSSALMKHVGAHEHDLDNDAEILRQRGASVLFLAVNGRLAGLLAVTDPVREGAPEALRALNAAGIHVIMATGDAQTTARCVGQKVGIAETYGEITPAGKMKIIKRLRKAGHVVGMAGDGNQDDPALSSADVSIATGTGSFAASKGAHLTLVRSDLRAILAGRRLATATVRKMRQNVVFSLFYNVLCIPFAGGLLYPWTGWLLSPVIAAGIVSLGSGVIIANTLRLRARR